MEKLKIIFRREYITRVTARSFLLTTFLTPLAFALIIFLPALAGRFFESETYTVEVADPNGKVIAPLSRMSEGTMEFVPLNRPIQTAQAELKSAKDKALLILPEDITKTNLNATFYANQTPSVKFLSKLEDKLLNTYKTIRLEQVGLSSEKIAEAEVKLNVSTKKITEKGEEEANALLGTILGQGMAFLNYIMVLVYGGLLMRGVMEEKTSRIVEVIISSVRPIELMMGKILAIASVGLTQFLLWILLIGGMVMVGALALGGSIDPSTMAETPSAADQAMAQKAIRAMQQFNVSLIFYFIFYFFGGYLLYGSLFAAIGASVDQETDGQQFTTIVSLPFILSITLLTGIMNNPNGGLAFWFSMIPFFSPTIMMARMAATDVPAWQILLSMLSMILGVWGTMALAARIYRVGILMYGKKITVKELTKWALMKN